METVVAIRSSSFSCLSPHLLSQSRPGRVRFGSTPVLSKPWIQSSRSRLQLDSRNVGFLSKKQNVIRASIRSFDADSSSDPIAPLRLESPIGQFLSEILVRHPHLLPAAVDKQLEQLETDRNAENGKDKASASGTELVLYRRIAEVKANERTQALEEILYALVVQKFMDANVPLIPTMTPSSSSSDKSRLVDTLPSQEEKLERLHSPEAYEMIQNHLALILGDRAGDLSSVAQISKLKVGQVYAASVMYGYFLKRVDQRFQLEKSMKILPGGFDSEDTAIEQVIANDEDRATGKLDEAAMDADHHPEVTSWSGGTGTENIGGVKSSRLRNYVMSFDGESLQRYATIRSREAISIIEKHTEALFGRPEIVITPEGTVDSSKDERITISFRGLRQLVLEAVTFGSFLWDVESYVDSRYHFVAN